VAVAETAGYAKRVGIRDVLGIFVTSRSVSALLWRETRPMRE
jgi:hypothetical protein